MTPKPGDRIRMHSDQNVSGEFRNLEGVILKRSPETPGLWLVELDTKKKHDGTPWKVGAKNFDIIESEPTNEDILQLYGVTPNAAQTVVDFLRQLRDDPGMPLNFQADIDQYLSETLGVQDEV